MKKFLILTIFMIFTIIISSCSIQKLQSVQGDLQNAQELNQELLSEKQIIDKLSRETKLDKGEINRNYIWIEYVNIDEDKDLELLLSYRNEIHKGYFFIYDYQKKAYIKVFSRLWAVERMSGHDVIAASGNNETHQLTVYIIHMERGQVQTLWDAVLDRYDYTNPSNGIETHGHYYVDTNSILHYCYKIEKTDKNAKVISREFREEVFVWNKNASKYVKINP